MCINRGLNWLSRICRNRLATITLSVSLPGCSGENRSPIIHRPIYLGKYCKYKPWDNVNVDILSGEHTHIFYIYLWICPENACFLWGKSLDVCENCTINSVDVMCTKSCSKNLQWKRLGCLQYGITWKNIVAMYLFEVGLLSKKQFLS